MGEGKLNKLIWPSLLTLTVCQPRCRVCHYLTASVNGLWRPVETEGEGEPHFLREKVDKVLYLTMLSDKTGFLFPIRTSFFFLH